MASNVTLSNGAAYVLDGGLGVTNEYARTGIPFSALRSIFITHHHPDHNVEYGPLLLISWLWGTRQVRAYGPPPLTQITEDFLKSSKTTADLVSEDIHIPPFRGIEVHELSASDRSIDFSGDTVALEAVAQMATGADVLVHEAVDFPAIEAFLRRQLAAGMPGKLEDYMAHNRAAHASAIANWCSHELPSVGSGARNDPSARRHGLHRTGD
jgi:ribonuclease BN (tRNA processing enzyme)